MGYDDLILKVLADKKAATIGDLLKEVGGDSYVLPAILNYLVEKGFIKKTETVVGSNPVYYFPGCLKDACELLEKLILNYEKSKITKNGKYVLGRAEVLRKLMENKVLLKNELTKEEILLLCEMPELAIPGKVKFGGDEIEFWRYWRLSKEEVIKILKEKLEKIYGKTREEAYRALDRDILMKLSEIGRVLKAWKISPEEEHYLVEIDLKLTKLLVKVIYKKTRVTADYLASLILKQEEEKIPYIILTKENWDQEVEKIVKDRGEYLKIVRI